jgi:hypothetical protein
VTLVAKDAPMNTGLLIGAAAGIAFGMLAKLRRQPARVVVLPGEENDDGD